MRRNGVLALVDWKALTILVALMAMGLVNLWSASRGMGVPFYQRQLLWLAVGGVFGLFEEVREPGIRNARNRRFLGTAILLLPPGNRVQHRILGDPAWNDSPPQRR
mgnify:CR=1 FL=1